MAPSDLSQLNPPDARNRILLSYAPPAPCMSPGGGAAASSSSGPSHAAGDWCGCAFACGCAGVGVAAGAGVAAGTGVAAGAVGGVRGGGGGGGGW